MSKEAKAFIGLMAVLIVLLFIQTNRLSKIQDKVTRQESVIAEKNAIIEYRTNENGKIVAEKEAAVLKAKELEDAYPKIYESLKKDMDINAKNLKAFIQNEFEVRGTGQGSVTTNNYYDTTTNRLVRFREFNMDDGYLKFNTRLYDSLSGALYSYSYTDTAKTAISSKRAWLFAKEKLYATTMFQNPNAKITGTTNILVDTYKDKRFSVGISAGWGIVKVGNDIHTGWFAGPSVSYSLFKF